MEIIPLSAFSDNYIWLLVNSDQATAICVDPGDASPVKNYLSQHHLDLEAILITHHHPDHVDGVPELLTLYPQAQVFAPNDSRLQFDTVSVYEPEHIHFPWISFAVLDIPGHTATHICYYAVQQELLFCGDTLFSAGCGRVFDGSYESLFASLTKLSQLPANTKIYCGHEYTKQNLRFAAHVEPSNKAIQSYQEQLSSSHFDCSLPSLLSLELQVNPFLRTNAPEIQAYALSRSCHNTDAFAVFKQLREDKNHFP